MGGAIPGGHDRGSIRPVTENAVVASAGQTESCREIMDLGGRFHHALYDRWILGPDRSGRFRSRRGHDPISGIG
jgi:hypothetical protein